MGSSGLPDTTNNPAVLSEKFANSPATSGVVAGLASLMYRYGSGSNQRGTALYGGMQDIAGWSGTGSIAFSEAVRGDCRLAATALKGSCYGGVFAALDSGGAGTHTILAGVEVSGAMAVGSEDA